MKNLTISGNIGKNAETRTTQGGDKVTSWTVAVEDRSSKEKVTYWFDCNWWGKRGESVAQWLTKGSKVSVTGDLGKREYEGKTYLVIRVSDVTLMGGGQGGGEARSGDYAPSQGGQANAGGRPSDDYGDEIPFAPEWRI
jgi:single-strand DNA-binding protein